MALTKKMLQAMDIAEDKIEQIIDAHRDSINGLTETRDQYKDELDKANAELARLKNVEKDLVKAQAKLDEAADTAKKLKDLQDEFDTYKADVDAKAKEADKAKAYRALLKEAGISEKRFDAIMRVTDLSEIELDKDGKIKDAAKSVESIKSEWADFIVTESKQGTKTATPPENNGGSSFEKMSLAEKMAYANENPNNAEVQAWLK